MNTQTTMPPVRKTVTVKQPPDRAFALFTSRIGQWWPGGGVTGGDPGARPGTVVLEPRPQGKIYRRYDDGSMAFDCCSFGGMRWSTLPEMKSNGARSALS
jgi:hypothetical protein